MPALKASEGPIMRWRLLQERRQSIMVVLPANANPTLSIVQCAYWHGFSILLREHLIIHNEALESMSKIPGNDGSYRPITGIVFSEPGTYHPCRELLLSGHRHCSSGITGVYQIKPTPWVSCR